MFFWEDGESFVMEVFRLSLLKYFEVLFFRLFLILVFEIVNL